MAWFVLGSLCGCCAERRHGCGDGVVTFSFCMNPTLQPGKGAGKLACIVDEGALSKSFFPLRPAPAPKRTAKGAVPRSPGGCGKQQNAMKRRIE